MRALGKNIPPEMRAIDQWVAFRKIEKEGHWGKAMISPNTGLFAKSNDPSTWSSFDKAYRYAFIRNMNGLAFVLTNGITFIDLDNCVSKEGELSKTAGKILEMIPEAYAELSVSKTGIHIFAKGEMPEGSLKRNDRLGIEMYDTKRFCCMTGDILPGRAKNLIDSSKEIAKICREFLKKREFIPKFYPATISSMDDRKVIERMLSSKDGYRWQRLYNGDISNYPSHSNADMALVCKLSSITSDASQIDRIFRSSGLYREKWDSPRGDSTYGEITINSALSSSKRMEVAV